MDSGNTELDVLIFLRSWCRLTLSWGIFDLLGSFLIRCGGREYSSRLTKNMSEGRLIIYTYLWLENLVSRSSSDDKFMASFTSLFRFLKTFPLESSLNILLVWPSGNLGSRVGNVELWHGLCHQLIAQVNLSLRLRQFTESEQHIISLKVFFYTRLLTRLYIPGSS